MSIARSASSLQLARETRERFVLATEGVIVPLARAIRDRLASQSSEAGNARAMQEHRDDFVAFQGQGSQWISLAQTGWRKALSTSTGSAPSTSSSALRLELIGDEVVESNILSSRLAQLIHDKASFELSDLRLRIQHLEGTSELDSKDVLKPETLAKLLVEQWLAAGLSRGLWSRVQDAVQAALVDGVVKAYESANAFLIANGVMPEIDLKSFVRRTGNAGNAGGGRRRPAPAHSGRAEEEGLKTQTEKATIEIVALMFQSILSEERIPFAVRVWFARLQMPVLRVALAEPEFFGTLQHPARS
jgi:hypothetical protein